MKIINPLSVKMNGCTDCKPVQKIIIDSVQQLNSFKDGLIKILRTHNVNSKSYKHNWCIRTPAKMLVIEKFIDGGLSDWQSTEMACFFQVIEAFKMRRSKFLEQWKCPFNFWKIACRSKTLTIKDVNDLFVPMTPFFNDEFVVRQGTKFRSFIKHTNSIDEAMKLAQDEWDAIKLFKTIKRHHIKYYCQKCQVTDHLTSECVWDCHNYDVLMNTLKKLILDFDNHTPAYAIHCL